MASIPKSPPQKYSSSRQLIAGSDMNNLNDASYSYQLLTVAGATQATAVQSDAANVEIAAAAPAGGMLLPVSYPGASVNVLNNSGNTTTVYGQGTDVVQTSGTTYAAAATGVTMATLTSATYTCFKQGFWQRGVTG